MIHNGSHYNVLNAVLCSMDSVFHKAFLLRSTVLYPVLQYCPSRRGEILSWSSYCDLSEPLVHG